MKAIFSLIFFLLIGQLTFAAVNRFDGTAGDTRVTIDIYDSQSDPVLVHTTVQGDPITVYLDTNEVERFSINEAGAVTIEFIAEKSAQYTKAGMSPVKMVQLTKGKKGNKLALVVTTVDGKESIGTVKLKNIYNADYSTVKGQASKVFENGNKPIPFTQYVESKGLPKFTNLNGSGSSFGGGYSYSSIPSVDNKAELKLPTEAEGLRDKIWDMLQMENKPTVAEFLSLMKGYDGPNPFKKYQSRDRKSNIERVADIIAKFEKVYPGATWYGLGRDVYLLNDAIDAFYIYIGQPGRVVRLHASQPSFEASFQDDKYVYEFLKSSGIDLDKIDKRPPQIIFDTTSYGNGQGQGWRLSQSRHLMRAAYNKWKEMGKDPKDLFRKLNFIAVNHSSSHVEIKDNLNVNAFFKEVRENSGPTPILTVLDDSLAYCREWHGVYGKFYKADNGTVLTSFSRAGVSNGDRLSLLEELWQIRENVMKPAFVAKVGKLADKFQAVQLSETIKAKSCKTKY